jgi:hypothetical protein
MTPDHLDHILGCDESLFSAYLHGKISQKIFPLVSHLSQAMQQLRAFLRLGHFDRITHDISPVDSIWSERKPTFPP